MYILKYGTDTYEVDHAVKGADYVHGYDADGNCIVSIEGISSFSTISYSGTYLVPTECEAEPCNDVKHVNGELLRRDGTPASHKHSASDIDSGTLSSERLPTVPVAKGGTGATTAAAALSRLGAVPLSGGKMTGALTINGLILTAGVDYGDTLPAAGTPGRLFFKKV